MSNKPAWYDKDSADSKRPINLIRASDVTPKKLSRVWDSRFYAGKLGFVVGEAGVGKSLLAAHMAAMVSSGGTWPGGSIATLGDVVYVTAEDDVADTVRPRLEAAGADLRRVHLLETVPDVLGPRKFNLVADLGLLDQCLGGLDKPALVIIDPINGCLGSTHAHPFNTNSVPQVRTLLGRLEAVAVKHEVAVVCVTHFTKAKGGNPLSRVTGSFAFMAAARSVFTVTRKNDDPNWRIFSQAKNNLVRDGDALEFRVQQRFVGIWISAPRLVFGQG